MEVTSCKDCGRIFNYVLGVPICPACKEKAEAKFQEVKDYITKQLQQWSILMLQ